MHEGAEVVRADAIDEIVHGRRCVRLRREWLRLPASGDDPPLAIERTCLPTGPVRAPVILVHGLAQNRFTWRVSQRSFVGRLAEAGYDVLNLELRGHGDSRRYGAGNARHFDEYVRDLVRAVAICDTPPFAIGHSLGGAVVLAAATLVPVRGIVHLAGVYTFASANAAMHATTVASLALERVLTLSSLRVSTHWAGALVAKLYSLTDIAGFGLPFAGWSPGSLEREVLEERLVQGFDWTSIEVWLQLCRWANGEPFPYGRAFSLLERPLLVMAGDADPLLPPADARACFEASRSPDRTFVVLDAWENRVHWGHIDLILGRLAPEESWPRIVDWMDAR